MRSEEAQLTTSLRVQQHVIEGVLGHALKEAPVEACGYLSGDQGLVTSFTPLRNADNSPEHYSFDPAEQFGVVREIRKKGMQLRAVYHSHPASPARPSEEDIRLAYDPNLAYLIVSLQGGSPVVKSFLIRNGVVEPQEIEVVL